MTYPQQPAPQYPPAQPQQAYTPQQPMPPAQPQQAYTPQQPPPQAAPQQAPLPHTTLADFADQPGAGGTALQFPVLGHRHVLTVARSLGDGDFPPQTTMPDQFGRTQVKTFSDGRPMVRMVIPALVPQDAAHPDGHATLSVQGQMAEALKQAMAAVGAGHLKGIPEDHSVISVAWTSERPAKRAGYNAQKIYEVVYQRPPGAAQADAAAQQAPAPVQAQQAPPAQYVPNGQQAPAPQPGPIAQIPAQVAQQYAGLQGAAQPLANYQPAGFPQGQQPAPQVPPAPQYAPPAPQSPVGAQIASATQAGYAAAQQAQAPPAPQPSAQAMQTAQSQGVLAPPPGMTPENAALIAQLTGQPVQQ